MHFYRWRGLLHPRVLRRTHRRPTWGVRVAKLTQPRRRLTRQFVWVPLFSSLPFQVAGKAEAEEEGVQYMQDLELQAHSGTSASSPAGGGVVYVTADVSKLNGSFSFLGFVYSPTHNPPWGVRAAKRARSG